MCTDPRECVCALWLCLMITMWGIIANTCEPFPFAAMKSLHEKRAREQTAPPNIPSLPLRSILRGQRSAQGDQCDQTQEYCFKKQETWEAACNKDPFGSKGQRESWRNSSDPPSWLPKQSGILQEPFGYDQFAGLPLPPIHPLKRD